jgi:hypothetical protein
VFTTLRVVLRKEEEKGEKMCKRDAENGTIDGK